VRSSTGCVIHATGPVNTVEPDVTATPAKTLLPESNATLNASAVFAAQREDLQYLPGFQADRCSRLL
jgi:hypothetical protein